MHLHRLLMLIRLYRWMVMEQLQLVELRHTMAMLLQGLLMVLREAPSRVGRTSRARDERRIPT